MLFEPIHKAIQAAKSSHNNIKEKILTIYLSPQGKLLDHELVMSLSQYQQIILLNGRYEGIDERIIENKVDMEISIGDYVLSGGELASMVLIDAITRQIPGALGHEDSAKQDSFANGLLDYPQYTRPDNINGYNVPKVLLSGDHLAIARFRRKQSLGRTWLRRKDLLAKIKLTESDSVLLNEFIKEEAIYA
ncbi:MAG: tRNA (guanine-N(1)-)-methyltransferase [uncultured bacterium]|nr:MAG: tRNA (guanine-N(1)-)-methyltransferase [uncultured bacterium]